MSEQTKLEARLAARLRQKNKGVHKKIKDNEAHVGGRQLAPGLEDAVFHLTEARMGEDKNEKVYVMLFSHCVDPIEFAGINHSKFYSLEDQTFPSGDKITAAENIDKFYNDLKLMGFEKEVEESTDEFEVYEKVRDKIASTKGKKKGLRYWLGNTRKKRGAAEREEPNVFVQGVPEDDYVAPSPEVESKSDDHEPVPAEASTAPFSVDDEVQTDPSLYGDDTVYNGRITALGDTSATVIFDDGAEQEVNFNALSLRDAEPSSNGSSSSHEEETAFNEGDAVKSTGDWFEDGTDYEGIVQSVGDGEATVDFDGEEWTLPFEYLVSNE